MAMKHQKIMIGHPLFIDVYWYDRVPEPPREDVKEGEIIGWRESQVLVRVVGYGVLRFWKRNGLEVSNRDYERRGWRIDLSELAESTKPESAGIEVELEGPSDGKVLPLRKSA
jgi:hypothetical protein